MKISTFLLKIKKQNQAQKMRMTYLVTKSQQQLHQKKFSESKKINRIQLTHKNKIKEQYTSIIKYFLELPSKWVSLR
jgi:hypothetical protein